MNNITIAIDAMGGDHGVSVVVPACLKALQKHQALSIVLVGKEQEIQNQLSLHESLFSKFSDKVTIINAQEVVSMNDLPSAAIRSKKQSSMRLAINLVKDGGADACVSAGNTGALMAISRFVLKTMPGIDRPAIIANLPTIAGKTRVIDLGANVDSSAEYLFQFAIMGSALIQALEKKTKPKIGLLNIGVEEIKGNDQIKQAASMLAECQLIDYVGYVEGNAFYTGEVDLVVCDGFVGNVGLKASEGLAKLFLETLKSVFKKNWYNKLIAFLAYPILRQLKHQIDPSRYNGASLLGLNGIVVKSHGGADISAFANAIDEAVYEVRSGVLELVKTQINEFVDQGVLL